jgi:hypothetical protein
VKDLFIILDHQVFDSVKKPQRFPKPLRFGVKKTSEVSKTSEVWCKKNLRGFQNL